MPAKRLKLAAALLASLGCSRNEAAVTVVDGVTAQYELDRRRHEDSIADLMANMTMKTAMSLLASNPMSSPELLLVVQRVLGQSAVGDAVRARLRAGQEPSAAGEVASVTDKLNDMIFETQAKYEMEHQKCCEYDRTKRQLIEETAQDIALFNAESAQARAGILDAQTHLQIASSRVPKLRESLNQNTQKCNGEISALNQQLEVILNDIPILSHILQLTDCDHPDNQAEGADKKVKMLLASHKVSDATRSALEHTIQEHETEMAMLAVTQVNSTNASAARRLQLISKHGQAPGEQPAAAKVAPAAVAGGGPCTKPSDGDKSKMKCAVGPGSCAKLNQRFLSIQVATVDKRDETKEEIKLITQSCKATNEALTNQIQGYEANIMAAQTSLARWTKAQNGADEQNRLKTVEKTKMETEFKEMTATCHASYLGFESQECGLRKIRGELAKLKNASLTPYFQDCQVSAWTPDQCSVSCGGGTQTLKRSVVTPPKLGVKCLPLAQIQSCNSHSCPVDCKVADWSAWSGCTAECGGGIQQRERDVLQKARYGGKPCGDASETRSCNIQSCNQDCVLNEWTEWSGCSKACGTGRQRRLRTVKEPARGTGKCADDKEETRLQFQECNTNKCPANLRCRSNIDLILVADGSGGMSETDWASTKNAVAKLATGFGGTGGAQVSVLTFGGPEKWAGIANCTGEGPDGQAVHTEKVCKLQWVTHITADVAGIKAKLDELAWPKGSRLTSAALGMAEGELNIGRKDTPAVILVITNGQPLSKEKTRFIANKLKKKARLTWVAVDSGAPVDLFRKLASEPDDENVLPVVDFSDLQSEHTVDHIVATICPQIGTASPPLIPVSFANAMTYTDLNKALDKEPNRGVCPEGRHVCNYQEVTVLSVGNGMTAPKGGAWIVGGFANAEVHRRSVWNGQDSTQCKEGNYPAWWDKWGPYFGRVHCHNAGESKPVACCGDVKPAEDPSVMKLSEWRGSYTNLNKVLDGDVNAGAVCGRGYHLCDFAEVTMYGPVKGSSPKGWIAGALSNSEINRRSVWNGQDSMQCKDGNYPYIYPQIGAYYGRVHCFNSGANLQAACCVNLAESQRPELLKLSGKAVNYNRLNNQLDSDWQGRSTCGQNWHVCNYQEATVYMSTTGVNIKQEAWIVGGFSNLESHRRSIWNGQDSTFCLPNNYPFVRPKTGEYYGQVDCADGKQERQVLCCADDGFKQLAA